MKHLLLILFTFLILNVESIAANKLEIGDTYSGTLTKLYWHKNTLMLPPGNWKLTELDKGTHMISGNASLTFENTKNSGIIYAYLGLSDENGIRWLGDLSYFASCADENKIIAKGKGKTHSSSQGKSYWCVSKDGSYTTISIHKNATRHYSIHYNFPSSQINLSKVDAERAGKEVFAAVEKAFKGNKNVDLNFLKTYYNKTSSSSSNNSSSSSSNEDLSWANNKTVCYRATSKKGFWNYSSEKSAKQFSDEAKSRNLSLEDCNKLTGRGNSIETSNDSFSIKSKLKELKSMLDEGLISQEQYDDKSSKILEEF